MAPAAEPGEPALPRLWPGKPTPVGWGLPQLWAVVLGCPEPEPVQ
ncbi:hypothetical protein SynWH8101_1018 [Synechococcus sp. WH 8101]|nr:hypothetical protein [Synechococcus sp. WH 8101]QBE68606.1 hypothetical protein SynWH8101_1018 [Synechococcus sp. WH 8101]QNI44825.1 hypothetical protein SynRCC2555_01039 [Synechococcus sp. WH 8101]